MTVRLSNSELQAYKRCKRKWWLTYYRQLLPKTRKVTGPLPLGSRVHNALEARYKNSDDLLLAYAELVDADRTTATFNGEDLDKFDKEAELGRIMLEGYDEWVAEKGLDAQLEILGAEETLRLSLNDGEAELVGKIDLRVSRPFDGSSSVLDFKTTASFDRFLNIAHMDEQLLTYLLLDYMQEDTLRTDGAIFRLMKKVRRSASAQPPFYIEHIVRHNIFTMRSFWKRIHGVIDEILRTRLALDNGADPAYVAYPSPRSDCSFDCNFAAVCPMFDDGSAVEHAITDLYQEGDAYERYGNTLI